MQEQRILPESIRVADRLYKIEQWDSRLAAVESRFGECDKVNRIIRIDCQFGPYQAASTLLHEVLHAIWQEYGIEDADQEERTVGFLQTALMQVFIDNPEFQTLLSEAATTQRITSFSPCREPVSGPTQTQP